MPAVRTRVLILSDTHATCSRLGSVHVLPLAEHLPPVDVAIHCGDLTSTGKPEEHRAALDLLKSLPAPTKVVIPGNHDLTLDRSYCHTHSRLYTWRRDHTAEDIENSLQLYRGPAAYEAGVHYIEEGLRTFELRNGAVLKVYASGFTPEFCDWGFAYPRGVDRFNYSLAGGNPRYPVPDFVSDTDRPASDSSPNIVMTHGPPKGILDLTTRGYEEVGCDHLAKAIERCKPLVHCFGHIHEGWGQETKFWNDNEAAADAQLGGPDPRRHEDEHVAYFDLTDAVPGEETTFINASIMDVKYNPRQKPWIVDMMLPAAESAAT